MVVFIGLAQIAYYGMLPVGIHILMVAAALALQADDRARLRRRERGTPAARQASTARQPALRTELRDPPHGSSGSLARSMKASYDELDVSMRKSYQPPKFAVV